MPLCIKTLSDNTGAEASSNKMFSMSKPVCYFLERLCLLSAQTNMEIDVGHIPGHDNIIADALSRWDMESPIPFNLQISDRCRMSLQDLWISHQKPQFYPQDICVPWSLPR